MMQPFIWGSGGEKVTPQEAARQRQMAEALMGQNSTVADNPWDGIAQVARSFTGTQLNNRAAEAERIGQEEAAALFGQLDPTSDLSSIMTAAQNPWASDTQRAIAEMLMQQEMQEMDPLRQLEIQQAQQGVDLGAIELEQARQPAAVEPVFEGGRWWDTSSGQPVPLTDPASNGDSAREQEIARLIETGMDRITAINIADGRWVRETNPVTGEFRIMDMATGQPVNQTPDVPPAPEMSQINPAVQEQFGQQFSASPEAFGVGGAAQGGINTVMDAIGVGAPYPDVQQTQADFGILRESLLNDIASSYGRQPPSWLLQEIRNLTPAAGSPFEGAGQAVSKLNALGRHLENEIRITQSSLERELSPTNRQELEARLSGLTAGLSRVTGAIASFDQEGPAEDVGEPPEGVAPELWQVMTPEERALWQ